MLKKFSRNSGFTLVEIMIAAAALGGLALVGMQLSKTQLKTSVKGAFDSDANLITNEILAILSDPVKCMSTLGGKNALSTTTGINSIYNNKYYSVASGSSPSAGYGNSNIKIESYALKATAADVSANNSFLIINYQNKNILKGNTGNAILAKKINLYVEVDGSNNILKCRSLSASSTDIWSRATGNSNIFYSGGNVGIGNNNPLSDLDIYSDANQGIGLTIRTSGTTNLQQTFLNFITKDDGTGLSATANNKGWSIYARGNGYSAFGDGGNRFGISYWDGAAWNNRFSISPDGKIGIGTFAPGQTLSVNGVIESTSGGIKFPDGTVQASAAATKISIAVYQCPDGNTPGWCPGGGDWYSQGCEGQISSQATCTNQTWGCPGDTRACTYLGKLLLAP